MALTQEKVDEIWKILNRAIPLLLQIDPKDLQEVLKMGRASLQTYQSGGPAQEADGILYLRRVADMESRILRLEALANFLKVSRETDLLVSRSGGGAISS